MDCPLPIDWLDYLEGREVQTGLDLQTHLVDCPGCRMLVDTLREQSACLEMRAYVGPGFHDAPRWQEEERPEATPGQVWLTEGDTRGQIVLLIEEREEFDCMWYSAVPLSTETDVATGTDLLFEANATTLRVPLAVQFRFQTPLAREQLRSYLGETTTSGWDFVRRALDGTLSGDHFGPGIVRPSDTRLRRSEQTRDVMATLASLYGEAVTLAEQEAENEMADSTNELPGAELAPLDEQAADPVRIDEDALVARAAAADVCPHDQMLDDLLDTLATLVRGGKTPAEAAGRLKLWEPADAVDRAVEVYRELARNVRTLRIPPVLSREGFESWYVGPGERDRFWPALHQILLDQGWNEEPELRSLGEASTKIVAHLEHPGVGEIDTRGLVLGHVQAGKTTNFTAVIAKAADAGYKLFVVLSGIHNGLRYQTQARLRSQLVEPNPQHWIELTTVESDFERQHNANAFLTQYGDQRVLCVIKKNGYRLRNLLEWLDEASQEVLQNCPVLIIDDEADQASINTSRPGDSATRINSLIRRILDTLPKAAYIGYTATPFANVFIDPSLDDLYPKDFIVDLPQPPGHFGTEVIFGRDPLPLDEGDEDVDGYDMVRRVPDHEVVSLRPLGAADRYSFEPEMAASLEAAVRYFWLSTAARRVRGTGNLHSTMLVHTSVYTIVHQTFRGMLARYRDEFVARLERDDSDLMDELRTLWDDEVARVAAEAFGEREIGFDELNAGLLPVVRSTTLVADNSQSTDRLFYGKEPQVVIAIGGNTLSRGLTLEGLSVSFFIRAATAYDTLLQMGRWFGYRAGYADLPRIWLTDELATWFRDLATVEREMRYDIERYELEHLTPLDFAVRIRKHPKLTITAASKMRRAVDAALSYGGERLQTIVFKHRDAEWLEQNLRVSRELISDAIGSGSAPERIGSGNVSAQQSSSQWLLRHVPVEHVLRFLGGYQFHGRQSDLRNDLLSDYIRAQNAKRSLTAWNVAIMGRTRAGDVLGTLEMGLPDPVALIRRARLARTDVDYADIKALMSKEDRVIDLAIPPEEARKLSDAILQLKRNPPDWVPADESGIGERGVGLLLLYPISKDSPPRSYSRVALDALEHVIGLGLVFPEPDEDTPQGYVSADLSGIQREETLPEDEPDEEPMAA